MLKIPTFSLKGIKKTDITLPKSYETDFNPRLLAQVLHVYEERIHVGLVKTKTRAEVNRTKKKWYKQKGTGGARHGAKSAPIFVGGGVAHGPRPIKRVLSLPEKMKKKALWVALSKKARDKEVIAIDGISKANKTAELRNLVNKIYKGKIDSKKRFTFVLGDSSPTQKVIRNLKNVRAFLFKDLNAYDLFYGGTLLLDKDIFATKKK